MNRPVRIGIILPHRETFRKARTGAVGLCIREFALYSRFAGATTVFGGTDCDYDDIAYVKLDGWKKWYRGRNDAYARKCAEAFGPLGLTHVEVHNRPLVFHRLSKMLPADVALSLHLHNDPQGMRLLNTRRGRQKLLDRAQAVYCVSNFIREKFVKELGGGHEKVHVIPNGFDTSAVGEPSKEKIVFFAGRMLPSKGILELIEGFALVMRRLPDWRLVVSGEDELGLFRRSDGGPGPWAGILGSQCDYTGPLGYGRIMEYFARAEIAAVPSVWQEPFGRTALEALATGAALITSGSGGLREIVGDDTALIVNPMTREGLAGAILRLAEDEGLRRRLQDAGRARARRLFDIRDVAARLDSVRMSVL